MSITPQFIYGKDGLPTNVVISFEEWQSLQQRAQIDVPAWQIQESMQRIAGYERFPDTARPLGDFLSQLDNEDATEL